MKLMDLISGNKKEVREQLLTNFKLTFILPAFRRADASSCSGPSLSAELLRVQHWHDLQTLKTSRCGINLTPTIPSPYRRCPAGLKHLRTLPAAAEAPQGFLDSRESGHSKTHMINSFEPQVTFPYIFGWFQ